MTANELKRNEYEIIYDKAEAEPFGKLTIIEIKKTKTMYALKEIIVRVSSTKDITQIFEEINKMKSLPNIVPYKDGYYDEKEKKIYLSIEYFEKNLIGYMKEQPLYSTEENFKKYFPLIADIISGVQSLSQIGKKIEELNPESIYVKGNKFFLGYYDIENIKDAKKEKRNIWRAPEISSGKKYSPKAIIYSLGILVLYLIDCENFSKYPNADENTLFEQLEKYKQNGVIPLIFYFNLQAMLSFNPLRRPDINELVYILKDVKKVLKISENSSEKQQILEVTDNKIQKENDSEHETPKPKFNTNSREKRLNKEEQNNSNKQSESAIETETYDKFKRSFQESTIEAKKNESLTSKTKKSLKLLIEAVNIQSRRKKLFDDIKDLPDFNLDQNLKSVSEPKPMAKGLNDYRHNTILQALVKELSGEIPVYRSIRGDGNCFYRSFGFLFLEHIFMADDNEELIRDIFEILDENENFLDVCKDELDSYNTPQTIQSIFREFLKLLYNYSKEHKLNSPKNVIEKLTNLLNKCKDFDIAVVLLIRAFALKAVKESKAKSEIDYFEIMKKEISEISEWGKEAEQFVINLLSEYLKVDIVVYYQERNQLKTLQPKLLKDAHISKESNGKIKIHLYFRPGHYDSAYDVKYSKNYYRDNLDEGLTIIKEYMENLKAFPTHSIEEKMHQLHINQTETPKQDPLQINSKESLDKNKFSILSKTEQVSLNKMGKLADTNINNKSRSLVQLLDEINISTEQTIIFNSIKYKSNVYYGSYSVLESVSEPYPLANLMKNEYTNYSFQLDPKLISEISDNIPVYRRVLRDNNSFYRSFSFLFMEYLFLIEENEELFRSLIESLIDNTGFLDICKETLTTRTYPPDNQKKFLEFLKLIYYNSMENKFEQPEIFTQMLSNLFNKSKEFQISAILLIRAYSLKAVEEEIRKNIKSPINKKILDSLEKAKMEICNFNEWNKESEEVVINLLSHYLKIRIAVHCLQGKQNFIEGQAPGKKIQFHDERLEATKTINLCYSSHYEISYDALHSEKIYMKYLVEGLSIKELYQKNILNLSIVEPKQNEPKKLEIKLDKIQCFYCQSERNKDEFIFFEKCNHEPMCLFCIIRDRNLRYEFTIHCPNRPYRFDQYCNGKIEYANFRSKFEMFRKKNVCHFCFLETDRCVISKTCGHKFCLECYTCRTISAYCLFRNCTGTFY